MILKKIVIGNRTGQLRSLNLRTETRMGDLAAARIVVEDWRRSNSSDRLIIGYDPHSPSHEYSRHIPLDWVFGGVADALWTTNEQGFEQSLPGQKLYELFHEGHNYLCFWDFWRQFRSRVFQPSIRMRDNILSKADDILKRFAVPDGFIAVQALCDAKYNTYRNAPLEWWIGVCEEVAKAGKPVVLLGAMQALKAARIPKGVFPVFREAVNPYEAMAVGCRSKVFVGGETGLPLWMGIFKVPVVAALRKWGLDASGKDFRPISFGAPVVYASLDHEVAKVAEIVVKTADGGMGSTPA